MKNCFLKYPKETLSEPIFCCQDNHQSIGFPSYRILFLILKIGFVANRSLFLLT